MSIYLGTNKVDGNLTIDGQNAYASKIETTYTTTTSNISTIPIGISTLTSADILFVDINGLDLIQGTDYTISGTNIVLANPITTIGTTIHFVVIRMVALSSSDYTALKGDKGDQGDIGNTGATPSFSIGTVVSGDSAAATITGTDENPVLNMTLPKGDKGDKGDQGDPGTHTISYQSLVNSGQQVGTLTIDGVSTPIYTQLIWQ